MKKSERNLLIVLGILLIPVAFLYIDFGGNNDLQSKEKKSPSNPMEEAALIMAMIPGGGKSPQVVTLSRWGRDIFNLVENTATSQVVNIEAQFFLSGIMTSGFVRSAIINDEVVTEGQMIDRYIVESILEDMVILSRNQKKLVLSLSE
ncbi:MAG TPA: hypothetical protein EYN21_05095 [Candidatus Marinimicrobia bacterium]|nr:hypothetical protein [Candidatus Neomarinimicrobiota bacterium]